MQSLYPDYQNGSNHLEQWDRVCRWYKKVKKIQNKDYDRILSVAEQEDFLLAFFSNAHQLKDWVSRVKNDDSIKKLFYKSSGKQCLVVLSDFITNYKHFENNRNKHALDKNTWLFKRDAQSGDKIKPTHTWWIQSQDKEINLYILADEVFIELETYMKSKGYID